MTAQCTVTHVAVGTGDAGPQHTRAAQGPLASRSVSLASWERRELVRCRLVLFFHVCCITITIVIRSLPFAFVSLRPDQMSESLYSDNNQYHCTHWHSPSGPSPPPAPRRGPTHNLSPPVVNTRARGGRVTGGRARTHVAAREHARIARRR